MVRRSADTATRILRPSSNQESVTLHSCRLQITRGKDRGKTVDLEQEVILLGSMPGCDLVLNDDSVSRHHCEIHRQADGYHICDLKSTNGTFLKGVQIGEAVLEPDTLVQVGETEIRFQPQNEIVGLTPGSAERFGHVVGGSPVMRRLYPLLERVAASDITVLLEGETGTGKEVVARSIHEKSSRKNKPFRVIDCGALSENLVESHLFGHEKGAFTGAIDERKGAFESANGGTVFLDEIGELPPRLQPKLLRVLERHEVQPLGSNCTIQTDVRIVAATNRNLEAEIERGTFREDLFFRLAVIRIVLPPLKKRLEDLSAITEEIMQAQKVKKTISAEALHILQTYHWPGNVRELRNVLERASALSTGEVLESKDFLFDEHKTPLKEEEGMVVQTLEEIEKAAIAETLESFDWNKTATAKALGIAYSTLHEKIKKYGLAQN